MSETLLQPVSITGAILSLQIGCTVRMKANPKKVKSIRALIAGKFQGKENTKTFKTSFADGVITITRDEDKITE